MGDNPSLTTSGYHAGNTEAGSAEGKGSEGGSMFPLVLWWKDICFEPAEVDAQMWRVYNASRGVIT